MPFIGMLVFQLTGALLLLINCCKGSKKAIIKNCFPGSNIAYRDDDNNCTVQKDKLQKSAHDVFLNIVAFANLVVGYSLAAISPIAKYSTIITVSIVLIATIALLIIEWNMCRFIARKIYSTDAVIPYAELEECGVDTVVTDKEITDMMDDIFKN